MHLSTRRARIVHASASLLATLLLAACGKKEPPPKPPPPQVSYIVVQPRKVALTTDLPGRTTAYRIAEVRPQVNGLILRRMFVEGSIVKAGQQLYQIDPAPYRAALDSALAAQSKAEAAATSARLLAERYKPLAEARAVSKQDYDNAVASAKQAEADIASAKANVETARINLVYTRLLSPITGRTGRSSVTEGALVTSGQTTALVTIQQLDPIYVDVVQPSTLLLKLRKELTSGRLTQRGEDAALVMLTLEDGTRYSFPGKLKFSEVTVDQNTGSITLRSEFPNPNGLLLPGMFVHEQVQEGLRDRALMVPQQGVTRDPKGRADRAGGRPRRQGRAAQAGRRPGDRRRVARQPGAHRRRQTDRARPAGRQARRRGDGDRDDPGRAEQAGAGSVCGVGRGPGSQRWRRRRKEQEEGRQGQGQGQGQGGRQVTRRARPLRLPIAFDAP